MSETLYSWQYIHYFRPRKCQYTTLTLKKILVWWNDDLQTNVSKMKVSSCLHTFQNVHFFQEMALYPPDWPSQIIKYLLLTPLSYILIKLLQTTHSTFSVFLIFFFFFSFWIRALMFEGLILRTGIPGSYDSSIFNFSRKLCNHFHYLQFTFPTVYKSSFSSTSGPTLMFSLFDNRHSERYEMISYYGLYLHSTNDLQC